MKGNVVRFNFPNINLPDSGANQTLSNGYVQYDVRLKPNTQVGTLVTNTSHIYFDFNAPIQTNNVVVTLKSNCNTFLTLNPINQQLCSGDTLLAFALLSDSANIAWYIDSVFVSSDVTLVVPNLLPGFYQIECVASNAYCAQQISSGAIIHPLPPVFNLGIDTTSCHNPVTLHAPTGYANYLWNTGATTLSISAQTSGAYNVVVTNSSGCTNSDTITVVINQLPSLTFIPFAYDTLCLSSGSISINSGVPTGGTFSGMGVSGNYFDPLTSGLGLHTLFYCYTDSTGCSSCVSKDVYVTACLGLNNLNDNQHLSIYPNPIASGSELKLIFDSATDKQATFSIYDLSGRIVFAKTILSSKQTQSILLPELAYGVYNCVVGYASGNNHQKLVVVEKR